MHDLGAIGAAVARFPDTEEVTGSNPVSPTSITTGQSTNRRNVSGRGEHTGNNVPAFEATGSNARSLQCRQRKTSSTKSWCREHQTDLDVRKKSRLVSEQLPLPFQAAKFVLAPVEKLDA